MSMATLHFNAPTAAPTFVAVSVPYAHVLEHPERYYQGSDIVWMMISSALVFLMIPSLSLIYAGIGNRSFALTLFRLPLVTGAFVGFQWYLWGYTLTFTRSRLPASWWGGESRANAFSDVLARPIGTGDGLNGPSIPELVYVLYEGMFASFTAAVVCGGVMHKIRPARFLIFISIWSVLIYDPVARWSWDSDGWSNKLGTMDFAGGTPVHIVSGTTVGAFSVFYAIETKQGFADFWAAVKSFSGQFRQRIKHHLWDLWQNMLDIFDLMTFCCRKGRVYQDDPESDNETTRRTVPFEPYNVNYLALGTALLWFGWAGFNGGSALGGNLRAVSAWTSTHVAACAGGTVGVFWIWARKATHEGDAEQDQAFNNLTIIYFCDGAIAGLVAITPGSGYVPIWSAAVFGVVAATCVHFLKRETALFLKDDKLQVFAIHTGGGMIGMFLTGLFADPVTIGLDGHSKLPYPKRTKGVRLGYQLADAFAGMGYTFVVTLAILYFMKFAVYVFKRYSSDENISWWAATGFDEEYALHDRLEATEQQRWRDIPVGESLQSHSGLVINGRRR